MNSLPVPAAKWRLEDSGRGYAQKHMQLQEIVQADTLNVCVHELRKDSWSSLLWILKEREGPASQKSWSRKKAGIHQHQAEPPRSGLGMLG